MGKANQKGGLARLWLFVYGCCGAFKRWGRESGEEGGNEPRQNKTKKEKEE